MQRSLQSARINIHEAREPSPGTQQHHSVVVESRGWRQEDRVFEVTLGFFRNSRQPGLHETLSRKRTLSSKAIMFTGSVLVFLI